MNVDQAVMVAAVMAIVAGGMFSVMMYLAGCYLEYRQEVEFGAV